MKVGINAVTWLNGRSAAADRPERAGGNPGAWFTVRIKDQKSYTVAVTKKGRANQNCPR
jgi:hypothetical protein